MFVLPGCSSGWADPPDRCLRAPNQNQKHPLGDLGLGQVFLGQIMFAFPYWAVDTGNRVCSSRSLKATTETTRHTHQMGVVEGRVGSGESLPPGPRSTGSMPHPEVLIIKTCAAAVTIALIVSSSMFTKSVGHRGKARRTLRQMCSPICLHPVLGASWAKDVALRTSRPGLDNYQVP